MTETAAIITALGGFATAIIGALVLLGRLNLDVGRVKSSLTPNGGGSLHDAIRRIESGQETLAHEVAEMRAEKQSEHARLWAAIKPARRRFWRKR